MRGRKLVLNYTNGSPCPSLADRHNRRAQLSTIDDGDFLPPSKINDSDETAPASKNEEPVRRKNTIISLLCDRDPLNPPLTLSFVATPDECTYVFEARSSAACAGIEQAKQTLSPSGVFGVIAVIALLVYLVGGCVYSRTVLNQRGWRQLPNYALWAGIFGFFRVSACSKFPSGASEEVVLMTDRTGHFPHSLLELCPLPTRSKRLSACQRRDRQRQVRPRQRGREPADRRVERGMGRLTALLCCNLG